MKKKEKFDWGQHLCPTSKGVKEFGFHYADIAIGFGKTKTGMILLIRAGRHIMEYYNPEFWEAVI